MFSGTTQYIPDYFEPEEWNNLIDVNITDLYHSIY